MPNFTTQERDRPEPRHHRRKSQRQTAMPTQELQTHKEQEPFVDAGAVAAHTKSACLGTAVQDLQTDVAGSCRHYGNDGSGTLCGRIERAGAGEYGD